MDYKSGYDAGFEHGYRRGFAHGFENALTGRVRPFPGAPPEPEVDTALRTIGMTPKKQSKPKNPKRVKAMKMAQKKARLKSGKFRKGWGKSRLMKEYHRILKRL